MRCRWFHTLWLWWLLPGVVAAQDPYYKVIDESDGLPNNSVYDLFQDSKGFIWIATDDGLCRYDGHSFKRYTSSTQSSKSGANIMEDGLGRIWYENFDGHLLYVSGDTLIPLGQPSPSGFRRVGLLNGKIYQPAIPKLNVYDLNTLELSESLTDDPGGFGMMGTQGEHRFWVFAGKHYHSIDFQGVIRKWEPPAEGMPLNGVPFDYNNKVFEIEMQNPAAGIHELGHKTSRLFARLTGGSLIQQFGFGDGKLWICYVRGMEVIDAETGAQYGNRIYFPDKSITAMLIDREGNYWFGTQDEGLMLLPDFTSECIRTGATGLNRLVVGPMGLMAGSQNGELLVFDPADRQFKVLDRNASGHKVDFLYLDAEFLIDASPLANIRRQPGLQVTANFTMAMKDAVRVGSRYLAMNTSNSSGFLDLKPDSDEPPSEWDSIATASKNEMIPVASDVLNGRGRSVAYVPARKSIYFATSMGLKRVTPHGIHELQYRGRSFYCSQVEAHQGRLFALTTLGGLFLVDAQEQISEITDLPSAGPYMRIALLGDNLYVLSPRHLLQIDVQGPSLHVVNMISGLRTGSIHDMAIYDGRLALAADNGLILLDPNRQSTAYLPQLHLTDLRVGGKVYPPDSLVEVSYLENEIEISYSILNFRTGGDYPLYYRINDGAWNKTHPDVRQLLLAQLSPGEYQISFCLGAPGCDSPAMVHVVIRSPFWQRTWFYLLLLLLAAGIVFLIVWQRNRVVALRHAAKLEKLELENSLRQSTLTAIRSQMNPHFFFNALNTIQAFIFSDDKRNATSYLGKFSKLTRLVLEMSEKEYVSLSEEIEAITLYLELEKSRFGDDFQFQIEVGPGLSVHSLYLPSMIIQPFVENAVKHGLLHQTGQKQVRISFQSQAQFLVIEVDDNGIGRKRSEELNRARQERHQSFSVQANKKRIDILNAGLTDIGVVYTDKFDAAGLACGTSVKITLRPLTKD